MYGTCNSIDNEELWYTFMSAIKDSRVTNIGLIARFSAISMPKVKNQRRHKFREQ